MDHGQLPIQLYRNQAVHGCSAALNPRCQHAATETYYFNRWIPGSNSYALLICAATAAKVGCAFPPTRRRMCRLLRVCSVTLHARLGDAETLVVPVRKKNEAVQERISWLKRTEKERTSGIRAVRCRHMLLASKELADDLRSDLSANPESFAAIAQSVSLCLETASGGGDLGWIGREDAFLQDVVPSNVREAALAGQPGDLLKVCSTRGWHLLQIEDVMQDLRVKRIGGTSEQNGLDGSKQPRRRTFTVETMGCQMNQADSEKIEGQLLSLGMSPLQDQENDNQSDLVIVNTCSIRDKAEQRLYARLDPHLQRKKRGEDVTIVVTGCVAQQEGENLLQKVPGIDIVLGPQYVNRFADILHESQAGGQICATADARIMEDITMPNRHSNVCAWVNVIYGCNERCSYCVVPHTRGSEQSRPMESIKREIQQLASAGYREVTLLGQNIDAWGRDLTPRRTFADLLRYVGDVEGIERIRFLTSHPRYISDDLILAVRDTPAVCEQFHIPFQSGDDDVLRRMERGYTSSRYRRIVERIRSEIPDAGLSADAIVGFPGETEQQFENTLKLVEEVKLDIVNTATYSPRPNTAAATWPEQVAEDAKKVRLQRLNELVYQHSLQRSQGLLGQTLEVLVEGPDPRRAGEVRGRLRNGRNCAFRGELKELNGMLVPVSMTKAGTFSVVGEIAGEPH